MLLHPISLCGDPPQTKISYSSSGFSPENLCKLSVIRNPPPTTKLREKENSIVKSYRHKPYRFDISDRKGGLLIYKVSFAVKTLKKL